MYSLPFLEHYAPDTEAHLPDLDQLTKGKLISIMGAGVVGALAYTWSDTFWFSAVEGEVYAYSSLFTAIVFWLILKWENRATNLTATAG